MSTPTPPAAPRDQAPAKPGMRLSVFLMRLIGACVLPLLLLAAWLAFDSVRATLAERDREAADRATNFATAIDSYLNARISALHMLAVSPLVDDPARWRELYREAQGFRDSFGSHVILAAAGEPMRMLFNTRVPFGAELPPLPRPRGHAAAPAAIRTGKPAVGDTVFGQVAQQTLVAIAVPVVRESGTRHVLLAIFEIGQFQQRIEQVALPAAWSLSLLDGRGEVIARRAPAGFVPAGDGDAPGRFVVKSAASSWSVALEIPREVYRAPLRAAATALAAALLAAVLLAVLGGVLAGKRLSRSVAALTQAPEPGAVLPDIAEIARARRMLDEARRRRDAAEAASQASEKHLRATFDLAEVGIADVATDGRWLEVNRKLCDIVGYTRDELLARSFQEITHTDDLDRDLDHMRRLLAGEIPSYCMEKRYLRKDGGIVWINLAVALARKNSGEPDYFISVIEDISQRKRLEQGEREQTEALRRSEAEGRRLLAVAEGARRALLNTLEDQQLAANALRAKSEELDRYFSNSLDLLCIADTGGRFLRLNPEWERTLGYPLAELLGRSFLDFVHPEDVGATRAAMEKLSSRERVLDFVNRYRHRDGSYRWIEWRSYAEDGRVYAVARDISERKRAEDAQRESEARLRNVFEQASDGIYVISAENRYLDANLRGLELLGYTRAELLAMGVTDVLAPQEVARLAVEPPRMMSGVPHFAEWEHVRKDGATFPGEVSACRLDEHSYLAIVRDLTERRKAEAVLRESEMRYRSLFTHMVGGLAHCRMLFEEGQPQDYIYLDVNDAFEALTGLKNVVGRRVSDIIPGIRQLDPELFERLGRVVLTGRPEQFEIYLGALEMWFLLSVYRAEKDCFVAVFDVITERKKGEQEIRKLHEELQRHAADLEQRVAERTAQLEAAKIRAESADRVKSAFLATMSHELRTPLNSIIGFTGILLQKLPGPLNAEQEKQLDIVCNASRHLLALINDVLDISKVEAGEMYLSREEFDLRALLERLGAAFAPQAERRGLAFNLDIGENEAGVTGDARRVEQVLNNLLSNALKFTPRGTIELTLAHEGGAFVVAVTDTGVGIKPEDTDKLFRPFSQIDTGLPDLHEGTGLGLAISLHLVQAMGGRITAESQWGKGSRFAFTLPAGGKT